MAVTATPAVDVLADFPILARRVDGRPIAYLDSAATAQKPSQVLEALDDLLEVALDKHPHRLPPREAARGHVEDLRLVQLSDRAAVRG